MTNNPLKRDSVKIFAEFDRFFMSLALTEARVSFSEGEIPVGAVLIDGDGTVLSKTHNRKEFSRDPTAHAEMLAIREGSTLRADWRLADATLYVTKEPCVMCAGAIINSRIKRLVYGCDDMKGGAVESLYTLLNDERLNHQVEVVSGVLREECGEILRKFFTRLRHNRE